MLHLILSALVLFFPSNEIIVNRRTFLTSNIAANMYKSINYKNEEPEPIKPPENNEGTENSLIGIYDNNIYFSGPITDESIFALTSHILNLQQNNPSINLYLQSNGGSLLPTLGVVDLIKGGDVPINTYVNGYAASAATLISVVGATRFMNNHGVLLIHQLKMGLGYGKYEEIKDYSENANTLMNIIKKIYLENTNLDMSTLNYLLTHDLWLNSTVCKKYGIIDIIY